MSQAEVKWEHKPATRQRFATWETEMRGHQLFVIRQDLDARLGVSQGPHWHDKYLVLWNSMQPISLPIDMPIDEVLVRAIVEMSFL